VRILLSAVLLLAVSVSALPAGGEDGVHPVSPVLHVHSTWSTGRHSLAELATFAKARGVRAVFLTENFRLRFEYGVPPLQQVLGYGMDLRSLFTEGPEAFLGAVAVANRADTQVLFVPGAEVTPHYYWTGSPLNGTLANHDAEQNLHVLGLTRAEDYWRLPMATNPWAAPMSAWSLVLLAPALLVLPGLWMLRHPARRTVHLRFFAIREKWRRRWPAIACFAAAGLLLWNNYPFRQTVASVYDPTAGVAPHQQLIDYANTTGAIAVWKLPEATDYHEIKVAGRLPVTVETRPYPEALLATDRYDAFGGLYEQETSFQRPGKEWDRERPAWAIAESAYHFQGRAGKRLGDLQTVIRVPGEPTRENLLAGLRAGRMYALWRTPETGLTLDTWQITAGGRSAESGETIASHPGTPVDVVARVGTDGPPMAITVTLIRSGVVVSAASGRTPLNFRWTEPADTHATGAYYRLLVDGPWPHQFLANPIFLGQGPG
jgi:hypothetical protein